MKKFFLVIAFLLITTHAFAATKYFINGGVNNNYSSDTNWSTTSGGANDTTHATSADDVILDDNSPNCTVDAASAAKSINCAVASHNYANTLTLGANLTVYGSITFVSGMTFTPSTYKVLWRATGTLTPAGKSFYDLEVGTNSGAATYTLADNVTVTNDFVTQDCNGSTYTLVGSYTISIAGDITHNDSVGSIWDGAWTLKLNGSGNQNLTSDADCWFKNITIDFSSTGGTVYMIGTWEFYISGSPTIVYNSGTIDWVTNTSTVYVYATTNFTLNPGGDLYNLTFKGYNAVTATLSNDVTVTGTLTFIGNAGGDCTINGSSYKIYAEGDVASSTNLNIKGSFLGIEFGGGNAQTWTAGGTSDTYYCNIIFNKSGDTLLLSGGIRYTTGTMTYTAGTVDAGTSTLSIAGSCTLNTNGISWYNITHAAANTTTLSSGLTCTNTWTISANTTFSGAYTFTNQKDVTVPSGKTLNMGNATLGLQDGNFQQTGTFTAGTGGFTLSGASSDQVISTSGNLTFYNFTYIGGADPKTISFTFGKTYTFQNNVIIIEPYGMGAVTVNTTSADSVCTFDIDNENKQTIERVQIADNVESNGWGHNYKGTLTNTTGWDTEGVSTPPTTGWAWVS